MTTKIVVHVVVKLFSNGGPHYSCFEPNIRLLSCFAQFNVKVAYLKYLVDRNFSLQR